MAGGLATAGGKRVGQGEWGRRNINMERDDDDDDDDASGVDHSCLAA